MTPCPCGSGLRRLRCCDLDLATVSPGAATTQLDPQVEAATAALASGETERGLAGLVAVLELAPARVDALFALARLHRAAGRARPAETLLRRIVAIDPNDFPATNELTLMLLGRGAAAEAEVHARNAVRIAPSSPQAHNLMGLAMTEGNRPLVGEYHYREVLRLLGRDDPTTFGNLAWNLKMQGRIEEARALYAKAAALAPDTLQVLLGWARTEEADRRLDRAQELLDAAGRVAPGHAGVALTRATVLARQGRIDQALGLLDEDGRGEALGPAEQAERGRLLDRLGRYDEAFAAFDGAKRRALELGGRRYEAQAAETLAARLRGFFTARRLATLPRAATRRDVAQPIFIVGFPRSGTTLIEQTLSVHARIEAGDELHYVFDIAGLIPRLLGSPLAYPDALCELWMGDHREGLDLLRDHYLALVRQAGLMRAGASWFTDKMPLNETHLGLIHLMFPEAPIVHVLRHPLDVVLSVYSNFLTHGFCCAAELETTARHYALIAGMVAHYRENLPGLRYLAVRYEDVVDHQEREVRRILDFIGEAFDPRCLNFEENRRYARTASYAQVTEKLYDRARYRHLNYRAQLAPAAAILAPVIERLGYAVP